MTEPSLSSDVKSMLHDEHSQRLEAIESTLAQWQATVWAKQIEQRVATLEQVTTGPPEGPGFGQLEQRVAALEKLCAGCKEANELIESMPLPGRDYHYYTEPAPLPREELD